MSRLLLVMVVMYLFEVRQGSVLQCLRANHFITAVFSASQCLLLVEREIEEGL